MANRGRGVIEQVTGADLIAGAAERYGEEPGWTLFRARLEEYLPRLSALLAELYGGHPEFTAHLQTTVEMIARLWHQRPADLRRLDARRQADPDWFQSPRMLGVACYVDLAAGTLRGVRALLPHLEEMGVTYLHLMPLFLSPAGNNDGGYAISSYREVDPALGSMRDLRALAAELRRRGISLVLDFVFNHTSDEHEWAQRARDGDPVYREYYYLFDEAEKDRYQPALRDIFPDQRPGSFTWDQQLDRWVWTTFNSFQWDLKYANPAVFTAMAEEMLFLANQGAEILRMDALAFIWKQAGTPSESLPPAHLLVQAFNLVARIAAPAVVFKSEAIVHPDEVARYISAEECRLSYNPTLMALLWESLATREVRLLHRSMVERFRIPPDCSWVNYIRGHDDIGWTFDDAAAARLGINGYDHRQFLNAYYTGRFPGSFARGLPFGENPRTGDARISGTLASLAGLESALDAGDAWQIELAVRRILLLHSIILSIGGIPLLYVGDEIGTLNDYGYEHDPAKRPDSRWVHRPALDPDSLKRRHDPNTIEGRIFTGLRHLISCRRACSALGGGETEFIDGGNPHVFAYIRYGRGRLIVLANFHEHEQWVPTGTLAPHGLTGPLADLLTGRQVHAEDGIVLGPYQTLWLQPR